jgi:hypothetical protein
MIQIVQINCNVFRCGVYKDSYLQINPHLPQDISEKLVKEDRIWGCGKPFQFCNDKLIPCAWI